MFGSQPLPRCVCGLFVADLDERLCGACRGAYARALAKRRRGVGVSAPVETLRRSSRVRFSVAHTDWLREQAVAQFRPVSDERWLEIAAEIEGVREA